MATVANPISNFVYADTKGNIGYIAPGKYPIRQPEHTGEYLVTGTGEFDWQGSIPYKDLPKSIIRSQGISSLRIISLPPMIIPIKSMVALQNHIVPRELSN